MRTIFTTLLGAVLLGGCANGMNYTSATGPRFTSPEPVVVHAFARDTSSEPVESRNSPSRSSCSRVMAANCSRGFMPLSQRTPNYPK